MYLTQSFRMVSQDTEPLDIVLNDSNGAPLNLTDVTGWFTVAQVVQPTTDQIIFKKAITITDALTGNIRISFITADTAGVAGIFAYDLVILFSTGVRKTMIGGKFEIIANVTP